METFSPQAIASKEGKARMMRWGLEGSLKVIRFKFTGSTNAESEMNSLSDLIASAEFAQALDIPSPLSSEVISQLKLRKLSCSVLNMSFFDVLEKKNLVTDTGYLRKTMNDRVNGVDIDTMVTEMLLVEESEYFNLFTEAQRQEFLFLLFKAVFIGESHCVL